MPDPSSEETAPPPERKPEIPDGRLDPEAVKVVGRLRRSGHLAHLVGGCVRDLLLGMRPKDFDVATSAHPNQVKEVFRNCRLIGRRFRLAHVYFRGGKVIEVSTFRSNPLDELVDLPADLLIRHDNVFGSAEEDARRRDFTINGLFYDVEGGAVVDYVGGKADLAARLVRSIGDPDVRMREDPVRILRAIRFAAKCAFDIEPATLLAMKAHAAEIPRCAPPRVLEEVLKLVRSGAARRCFELLREVGVLKILLPPVHAYLELHGDAEAERHLRALAALDSHVRVGEVPSDAVLLATLLAPLPRAQRPNQPIPKAPPREPRQEAAPEQPAPLEPPATPEPLDEEGDGEEGSEDELEAAARLLAEVEQEAATAPLPEEALRSPDELHDERLGGPGIPAFTVGDQGKAVVPWSLPQGVVSPEEVLTEMVRSARLPRRIAERARLILTYQPYMSGERRKRKFSPQAFVRQGFFPEALAVFELTVAATGEGAEALARWQARFAGQEVAEPPPRPGAPQDPGRRRRRRRGGKRRGRGGPPE